MGYPGWSSWLVASLASTACVASVGGVDPDTGDTSGSTSAMLDGSTGPAGSSTAASEDTTGEPPAGSESSTTAVADPCVDVEPVDNPEQNNCDLAGDDCPPCHKCALRWDGVTPGSATYGGTVCVPVAPDAAGPFEPCTRGEIPGWDDCDAESMCWNLDPDTGIGYCIERCGPGFACDEPDTYCVVSSEAELGCLRTCDPLAQLCPAANEVCIPDNDVDGGDVWACFPDHPEFGEYGEACGNACAAGLDCVSPERFGSGCDTEDCCTDLCDLDGGTECMDPMHTCLPSCMATTVVEGLEHISVCGILPDPLPGTCRPPGGEPNYPWCSLDSDGECPGDLFGSGDDCIEDCFCTLPCDVVADCATPATGSPTVVCEPLFAGKVDSCLLSCAEGETCPDGMHCSEAYPGRCMWLHEVVPGCSG